MIGKVRKFLSCALCNAALLAGLRAMSEPEIVLLEDYYLK